MTILENNSSRLVVQLASAWTALLIPGSCLLAGFLLALSAYATTFTCKRVEPKEGHCALIATSILNSSERRFGLNQIENVRPLTSTSTDIRGKRSTNYSVQLATTLGNLEITKASSRDEQQQWVDQINAFLSNTHTHDLTLTRDGRLASYIIGAAFVGFGLWLAGLLLLVTTYTFDRTVGKLIIEKRWIGRRVKEYPLHDIRDLEIRLYENPKDDRKNYRRVFIELKSDRYITTNLPDDTNLINLIRTFVGMYNRPTP